MRWTGCSRGWNPRCATPPGRRRWPRPAAVERDRQGFRRAAELYRSLELPYQEARCLLEAGDLDAAEPIVERIGVGARPLGARLRELRAAAR